MSKKISIYPRAKEQLGEDFELTEDTAEIYYLWNHCDFYDRELIEYYSRFSEETILKWHEDYFPYIEDRCHKLYEAPLSLDNFGYYALYIYFATMVYTQNSANCYVLLKMIKEYISKYGYLMFHCLDTEDTRNSVQYPYADMFECLYQPFREYDKSRISIRKKLPEMKATGLIPYAIHFGLDDVYEECLSILKEACRKENLYMKKDIMDSLKIKYDVGNEERHCNLMYEDRKEKLNQYLEQFGRKIL